jgi:hypothetical protein
MSRKPTWLYAYGVTLPELNWSKGEQRLHPVALERYGYEKARRIGMTAMVGDLCWPDRTSRLMPSAPMASQS